MSLLEIMGEGDGQNDLEDDKMAAAEIVDERSGISIPSTIGEKSTPLSTASSSRSQPKKKLLESWDDEELGDNSSKYEDIYMGGGSDVEDDDSEDGRHHRSVEELERGFRNIYKAFSKLRSEFDEKFRVIFA